ncbi:Armadillo-type fold [Pseudocohnilembus persalinus]|uniref:Armadillo-type fold n=1 Tax=Pseudocohnilembus persalinus TaxID=266149 RepID=A0A0V0Q8U2_PSEPJ|nr:Armadillo-type fold [Pseudocohnilembus persalinus]|eukprot:KRW98593.1 Armadillo-type fold [Pseudocohnilembus persalinus]
MCLKYNYGSEYNTEDIHNNKVNMGPVIQGLGMYAQNNQKMMQINLMNSSQHIQSPVMQNGNNQQNQMSNQRFQMQQQQSSNLHQSPIRRQEQTQGFYYGNQDKDQINEGVSPVKIQKFSHFNNPQTQENYMDNNNSVDYDKMSPTRLNQQMSQLQLSQQQSSQFSVNDGQDQEFKEYKDIKGQIQQMSKINGGSRILQRFFHHCQKYEIDLVLDEIYDYLPQLVVDQYGNYMFQSLIQVSTVEQRHRILEKDFRQRAIEVIIQSDTISETG